MHVDYFSASLRAGSRVTITLLVREVLKIEEGDYVRININQVIKKKQQRKEKTRQKEAEKVQAESTL